MKDIDRKYFHQLLKKYRKGTATQDEINFLDSFYNMFEVEDDLITDENELACQGLKENVKNGIDERINQVQKKSRRELRSIIIRYAAAAAILLFVSGGGYWLLTSKKESNAELIAKNHIKPGGTKATLTLANGIKINLSNAINGVVAQQSNTSIQKNAASQLVYTAATEKVAPDATGKTPNNTITTPNGGQYEVVLPDGTHVTLNAASSLTFPVAFTGRERVVTLTGEAYFEVTKNKAMPFKVQSAVQTVTVLGTHFNVNAYPDEAAIKTTLLEGSVEVSAKGNKGLIAPGQQMIVAPSGVLFKQTVNTDKELAWKNGVFSFDGDNVKTIMRQIARWYNVEVTYAGDFPDEKFYGEIGRSSSLTNVLKIMELNNVHFDINGRRITVSYVPSKTQN